jgi:L-rhamnose mutarotase
MRLTGYDRGGFVPGGYISAAAAVRPVPGGARDRRPRLETYQWAVTLTLDEGDDKTSHRKTWFDRERLDPSAEAELRSGLRVMKPFNPRVPVERQPGAVVQRVCFVLKVREDRAAEYRRRHEQVWQEMRSALTAAGWRNYSLFLREDGLLVGYLETDDFERARAAMDATEVNSRWQKGMAGFFEDLGGRGPDTAMRPLDEVFHLA